MATVGGQSVVTLLFTDLVGSTQLTDALGDEGAQEILRIHNALVREEVGRHGGSEVKTMGDGFMIAFKSPTSALACAVAIQRAIAQYNREQPTREFMVRMGLNAGEAIQEEADFFGSAVIVAARIAALAEGGEILTSEAVKQLGQGVRGSEYEFKGEFQLKGFREPYRVYQVVSGPAGRPAVAALRKPQFVGRETEVESLAKALEDVLAGSGMFVLLSGEPGVGKSRLAEELARHSRTRGFRVWRGHCYGMESSPPYVPFVEALRSYIEERPDDVLLDELGDEGPEIAKLVPELRRRIPVGGDGAPLPPEQERYRLLEAVRHWLENLARRRPVLLLIEDLHWAGPATCLLLRHLAPSLTAAPILILGTCREEELQSHAQLREAVAEFGRLQVYRAVSLVGLTVPALTEMLSGMGGGEPPAELVEAIHEQTEGNPFFVTELINHLDTEGKLFGPEGGWRPPPSRDEWDVPESVRVVIERRLNSLAEATRKVLTVASVVGKDFTYDLLEALSEVPADALLDSLDEAIRMGMIEEAEGAAARFRFAHQLTRQALYDDLSGLRRRQLHLRVGEAMEGVPGAEPAQLAYHFSTAGHMAPPEKTRRYLTMAGDEARRTAAWEGAAAHYQQALELLAAGEEQERAELLRRLGEAQSGAGDWEGAVASWKEAMETCERLGDWEAAGWIGFSLRKLYGARGQFAEAAEVVKRSLSVVSADDSEIRSRLLAQAGFFRSAFGEMEEGEHLLAQSMEMAERLDNAAAKGFIAFIRGMHFQSYCRLAEAAEQLEQGVQWSLAGNDPWSASQSSSFRRHILFCLGDLSAAEDAMDEEERLARKAGNFLAVCETKWIGSSVACLRGDLPRAEDLAHQLLELIRASQADSGIPGALINLAYIRFLRGDWDSFEELLAEAISHYERMAALPIDDPRPVLMLLRALTGRGEEARAMLPDVERYLRLDDPWTESLGEARATLAAALAVLGEGKAGAALYEPLREWTSSSGYVLTGACSIPQFTSRALGMLAAATGRPDEAEAHFQTAIDQARQTGAASELASACYWYARCLVERGRGEDRERACDLLAQACQAWESLGMPRELERARSLEATVAGR